MIKKLLFFVITILVLISPGLVVAQVTTQGGGTGSTSPSGILFGDGTLHLKTVGIGANCTFSGGILNCTGGTGGSTFSTTSLSAVAPLQYSQSPLAQFSITQSGTGGNGYLSSTDFNTFNNKISSTSLSVTTSGTSGAATYTPSTGVFNIPQYQAAGTYLTSVAVATANGFAGSSSGGATPSLTLTTTITGLLKGNGTAISAATPGTDYDVFAWPFTPVSYGNATGTLIGFTGGILSVGSTTIVGNATTTGMQAFGSVRIPTLGVAAGTFLAVDPNGVVIATTTPQGTSGAFSPSANYGTVTGLPAYTSAAGVITEVGTGALSVDGNSPTVGQIVLVKNESGACTSSAGTCQNGLYNVTAAGSGIAAFVLTRNSNYNSSSNVIPGIVTYIISGATLADDFWALTTPAPITVGTTGLTYVEVSGGGAAVTSVSNSDSTLTISPTAGAVVASLNLGHSNTWSVLQNFSNATSTLFSSTYASTTQLTVSGQTGCAQFAAGVLTGTGSNCAAASSFPFTPNAASVFFGQISNSTTTQIHFGATPFALTASSTSVFANASTSLATIFTGLYLGANAEITSFTGTGLSISGGALGLTVPVSLANGGTNATSFTTSGNSVYYNGTSLLTAPLTTFVTTPFASSTALSATYASSTNAFFGTVGVGSTSPLARFVVAGGTIVIAQANPATSTSMTADCGTGFTGASTVYIPTGTGATTITLSRMYGGQRCVIAIVNPNTTPGAITWATASGEPLFWQGGTIPTATVTANKGDTYSFIAVEMSALATTTPGVKIWGAQTPNF